MFTLCIGGQSPIGRTPRSNKLLGVLQRLVSTGNTVLVIEHNLDVIKTADWIIDLGPEGGDEGGRLAASGAPERIARSKKSYTGQYLKGVLIPRADRGTTRASARGIPAGTRYREAPGPR